MKAPERFFSVANMRLTVVEALDICVLGRDITGLFGLIVDQPQGVVCMLGQRHRCRIEQD
jgi:hypothetical protein